MSEVWEKKRKKVSLHYLFGYKKKKSRFRGRGPPTKKRRWGVRREPSRPAGAKIFFREPLKRRRMHFQKPENRKIRKSQKKKSEKLPVL